MLTTVNIPTQHLQSANLQVHILTRSPRSLAFCPSFFPCVAHSILQVHSQYLMHASDAHAQMQHQHPVHEDALMNHRHLLPPEAHVASPMPQETVQSHTHTHHHHDHHHNEHGHR